MHAMRAAAILLALILVPATALAQGGGAIENVPPTVVSLSMGPLLEPRVGDTLTLLGTVRDGNLERDISAVRIVGPETTSDHLITDAERLQTDEPLAATDGWKVWNPGAGDGTLSIVVQTKLTDNGLQSWTLLVKDETDWVAAPSPIDLDVAGRGGGGGGGGGGAAGPGATVDAPTGTGAPEDVATTVGEPDTDGDGVSDRAETILGASPERTTRTPSFDMTNRLRSDWNLNDLVLSWDPEPHAGGYQIWRSTSPYVLLATVNGNHTSYIDEDAPANGKYKLTFFLEPALGMGWVEDESQLAAVIGWDEGVMHAPPPSFLAPIADTVENHVDRLAILLRVVLPVALLFIAGVALTLFLSVRRKGRGAATEDRRPGVGGSALPERHVASRRAPAVDAPVLAPRPTMPIVADVPVMPIVVARVGPLISAPTMAPDPVPLLMPSTEQPERPFFQDLREAWSNVEVQRAAANDVAILPEPAAGPVRVSETSTAARLANAPVRDITRRLQVAFDEEIETATIHAASRARQTARDADEKQR